MQKLTTCYAHLNAKIMPIARGKRFETPLAEALASNGMGQVAGGGTLQAKDGEIIHAGIDIDLQLSDENIAFVTDFLSKRGAPKGSKLQFKRNGVSEEIPFGFNEGIGVYINGTDLPLEVYRTSDINVVIENFKRLGGDACRMMGYWRGPRETALYLYGPSASEIELRIKPFMQNYPLCEKARVVRIA